MMSTDLKLRSCELVIFFPNKEANIGLIVYQNKRFTLFQPKFVLFGGTIQTEQRNALNFLGKNKGRMEILKSSWGNFA